MTAHPLTPAIADIESRIQDLHREKERLEMQRDSEDAPALIKTLLDKGCRFAPDHCHITRTNILIPDSVPYDDVLDLIRAYIGDRMGSDSKAVGANVAIFAYRSETPYLYVTDGPGGDLTQVTNHLFAALKALGIPKDRISVRDYEREVANHERNRARTQVDLDKVRALVAAY